MYAAKTFNITRNNIRDKIRRRKIPFMISNRNRKWYLINQILHMDDKILMDDEGLFLTRNQVAEYLKVSVSTLRRRKEESILVPVKDEWIYSRQQLDKYLQSINVIGYITIFDVIKKYQLNDSYIRQLIKTKKIELYY